MLRIKKMSIEEKKKRLFGSMSIISQKIDETKEVSKRVKKFNDFSASIISNNIADSNNEKLISAFCRLFVQVEEKFEDFLLQK